MRFEQGTAFAIVGTIMSWFVRDRLRYDLVATLALFATVMVGIVPAEKAFSVSDGVVGGSEGAAAVLATRR